MSGLSLEEYDLLGDSKYRAYVAAVDKTLRNFENTSEWADLISTLGKLNKVSIRLLYSFDFRGWLWCVDSYEDR